MEIALDLARKCSGFTFPNPPVGCVIVEYDKIKKDHKIVSYGQTQISGRPHAEFNAIKQTFFKTKKDYICYSSLEPCCHKGRSESCVSEILRTPIKKVVFSVIDPDKRVKGKGKEILKEYGITVSSGLLKKSAIDLYSGYFLNRIFGRPKITLKIASSLDGKIYGNKSKWITNEITRSFVHSLRFENDAILIGGNTAKVDNPRLDCRLKGLEGFSPIKIVISKSFDLSKNLKIFSINPKVKIIVFTTNLKKKKDFISKKNIEFHILDEKEFNIKNIIKKLTLYGISNVLVEGGAKINSFFLKENLVDDLIITRGNFFLGKDGLDTLVNISKKSNINKNNFILKKVWNFKNDVIEYYNNVKFEKLLKEIYTEF